MKSILVPVDFSKNANAALVYAIELAKKENAKLILLHAYHVNAANSSASYGLLGNEMEKERKHSESQLTNLGTKIAKAGKIKHESINRQGLAVDVVLEVALEKAVDLIVMGTKGANGIVESIMGSNTARVIEKAKCPVIAVPEMLIYKEIKKITYATNYQNCDLAAIEKLIEIAKPFQAQINLLHIASSESIEEKELMKKFMAHVNEKISYSNLSFQLLTGDNVTKKMEEYLKDDNCDLIAMSTHHRDLMDKLFGKSITKEMAFHTQVPLLAFHHNKTETARIF